MLIVFFIGRVSFIMSLFHVVRQSLEFYLNVLKRLREAVRRKRPEPWTNNTWMLHHDSAPAHTSLLIREFLTKHRMGGACGTYGGRERCAQGFGGERGKETIGEAKT